MDHTATRTSRSTAARAAVILLLALVTGFVSLAVAAPANAYQYAAGGYVGGVSWPRGECRDKPVWGQLQVIAKAPVVSSPNVHAGYGNDAFWARYRAYL